MNNKIIMLAGMVFSGMILATGCADHSKKASVYLRTAVPVGAKALTYVQDEDWFWCVLQLTPEQSTTFQSTIEKSACWHSMPLSPELMHAADFLQPHTTDFRGHIPIANTNGFYTFLDLEAEYAAKNPYPGSSARIKEPFQKRGALNYVFGYYDNIERKVYIWWCHT